MEWKEIKDFYESGLNEDTVYSFGDSILYKMCDEIKKEIETDGIEKKIASAIWLIGRSYAASPERQLKGNEKVNKFFNEQSKKVKEFLSGKMESYKNGYKYDFSDDDINALKESIELVLSFNEKLVGDGEDAKNVISFSSKFLHFFFRDNIFILDTISQKGSRKILNNFLNIRCNNKKKEFTINFGNCHTEENKTTITIRLGDCHNEGSAEKLDKTYEWENFKDNSPSKMDYIKHAIRSYYMGSLLKKDIELNTACLCPRIIDSIFLKVGDEELSD